MIRYGIVGIGGFAQTWVRSLALTEERGTARLSGAVVRNRPKYAEQVAALEEKGCTIYATLDEMLADGRGKYDVIGVPTGIPYHEPMAVQALEAGYNVLIEKPVAGTIQEVSSIAEAERRTGHWCAVGYQHIYSSSLQWLAGKLATGNLGRIVEGRTMVMWPRAQSYYERNAWAGQLRSNDRWTLDGPATNATAHYLSHMTYLAQTVEEEGFGVESVRAELYRAKDIPSYDTSCIEVVTKGGARLYHYVTHSCVENVNPETVLECERGTAHWDRDSETWTIRYSDGTEESSPSDADSPVHAGPIAQVARVAAGVDAAPLCGITQAGPHVLIINLAFESSMGIIPVTSAYTRQSDHQGSTLLSVEGIEDVIRDAWKKGGLFSDFGVPWAKGTQSVAAKGYTQFPSKELGAILKAD